jgi:hypothetical protein
MAQHNRESRHTIGGYRHRRVLREIREQQLLDDAEGVLPSSATTKPQ